MQITKKLLNKGYTITVVSCENYGNSYKTKSITVDTIEEAKAWYELMMLCKPYQKRGDILLGGSRKFSLTQIMEIFDLFFKNKNYYKINDNVLETIGNYFKLIDSDEEDFDNISEDDYILTIQEDFKSVVFDLMDEPDETDYACRYVKSCVIEYSPENVFATIEQIKF